MKVKIIPIREIAKDWLAAHPHADEDARDEALRKIVRRWLAQNSYNGLAGDECGCGVWDFMPCGSPSLECVAGHLNEETGDYLPGKIPLYKGSRRTKGKIKTQ